MTKHGNYLFWATSQVPWVKYYTIRNKLWYSNATELYLLLHFISKLKLIYSYRIIWNVGPWLSTSIQYVFIYNPVIYLFLLRYQLICKGLRKLHLFFRYTTQAFCTMAYARLRCWDCTGAVSDICWHGNEQFNRRWWWRSLPFLWWDIYPFQLGFSRGLKSNYQARDIPLYQPCALYRRNHFVKFRQKRLRLFCLNKSVSKK